MKALKIYNRDKTPIKNINELDFSSLSEGKINEVTIYENPKVYENKVVEVWNFGKPLVSGIIKRYTWNDNKKEGTIFIYPLIMDLMEDFIKDPGLSDPGDKIYYTTGQIEDILEDILDQYLASSVYAYKVLKKGTFATTGRYVEFTFYYNSLYEALEFLRKKMLRKGFYIKVDVDGAVNLLNITNTVDLKNKVDIEEIDFEERIDENIKKIIFDNKSENNHILKTYSNPNPSVTTGKVLYISDARFKDETSVDTYIEAYFSEKGSPKVEVESVISCVDVPLYSKVNIFNWDKNFVEIYVIGKDYLDNGKYNLKLGTETDFIDDSEDDLEAVREEISLAISEIPPVILPEYIKETYIDSTEIRSPIIKGNTGYIFDTLKVGPAGIIIDGQNKLIKSSGYVAGSSGWQISDTGNAEFNNATLRGDLLAGSININNQFIVDPTGNVRGNDFINKTILFEKLGSTPSWQDGKMWCEGNPTQKVLWGYFGGDTNKQQISTSRMQFSGSFDRTSSATLSYTTWFQPRILVFTGYFENVSQEIYGITNGQAGSVSAQAGFFGAHKQKFRTDTVMASWTPTWGGAFVKNLDIDINFGSSTWSYSYDTQNALIGYAYTTFGVWHPESINMASYNNGFAGDGVSPLVRAYVSEWRDNGITIEIEVASGWRLGGNFNILG